VREDIQKRLRVFEDKVLNIWTKDMKGVAGSWQGLNSEELHNLCFTKYY
jgi:hypothetical protein